ncbi:sensor histidine kinase [Roseicella frigidaeris]|nr:histidine kinase dimerization/phosphoacceptor domain -containing protein [Roseicella frigidaeris]
MSDATQRCEARLLAQQTALARFGERALQSEDLEEILHEACRLVAEGLDTGLAKVLELQGDGRTLVMRAGVGWRPGLIGALALRAEAGTLEALLLETEMPVVAADCATDGRFALPGFMQEHGVRAVVNVVVAGADGKRPYGILEVDSREARRFTEDEVAFLQSYANMLAAAVGRLRAGDELRARTSEVERLFRELQHRVKNNLQVIIGLMQLQARRAGTPETLEALRVVRQRVDALRLLHDKFYFAGDVDRVDLGAYLSELAGTLLRFHEDGQRQVRLVLEMRSQFVPPEQAAPLGLIAHEFVANSLKHAFDGTEGSIGLRLEPARGGEVRLTLWDDGRGLSGAPSAGTGMRLMDRLAQQLSARIIWAGSGRGTRLTLLFRPLPAR